MAISHLLEGVVEDVITVQHSLQASLLPTREIKREREREREREGGRGRERTRKKTNNNEAAHNVFTKKHQNATGSVKQLKYKHKHGRTSVASTGLK